MSHFYDGTDEVTEEFFLHVTNAKYVGKNRFLSNCPAHDDHTPSLSILITPDRKLLVKCHAGCQQQHVMDALKDMSLWPRGGKFK